MFVAALQGPCRRESGHCLRRHHTTVERLCLSGDGPGYLGKQHLCSEANTSRHSHRHMFSRISGH
jgi:hypothetical protein